MTTNDNHDPGTGGPLCSMIIGATVGALIFVPVVGSFRTTTPEAEVGVEVGISKSLLLGDDGAPVDDTAVGDVVGMSSIVTLPPPPLPNPDVGVERGDAVTGLVVGAGIGTGRVLIGTRIGAKIGGKLGSDVGEGPSTTPNCNIRNVEAC